MVRPVFDKHALYCIIEPCLKKTGLITYSASEDLDQPAHPHSLIRPPLSSANRIVDFCRLYQRDQTGISGNDVRM